MRSDFLELQRRQDSFVIRAGRNNQTVFNSVAEDYVVNNDNDITIRDAKWHIAKLERFFAREDLVTNLDFSKNACRIIVSSPEEQWTPALEQLARSNLMLIKTYLDGFARGEYEPEIRAFVVDFNSSDEIEEKRSKYLPLYAQLHKLVLQVVQRYEE